MAIAGLLLAGPATPGEHETRHLKLPSYLPDCVLIRRDDFENVALPRHTEGGRRRYHHMKTQESRQIFSSIPCWLPTEQA